MNCNCHNNHPHIHGTFCGHQIIRHDDHIDYLHDGCLHYLHSGHVVEHTILETITNPTKCTPDHACNSHDHSHQHSELCGHETVPHGDHLDYLVNGHLHHPCADHCDNHGPISIG